MFYALTYIPGNGILILDIRHAFVHTFDGFIMAVEALLMRLVSWLYGGYESVNGCLGVVYRHFDFVVGW